MPACAAEGVEDGVAARQRARVCLRAVRAAASVRPDLTSAIGLPTARAMRSRAHESLRVLDAFEIHAERA